MFHKAAQNDLWCMDCGWRGADAKQPHGVGVSYGETSLGGLAGVMGCGTIAAVHVVVGAEGMTSRSNGS